MTDKSLSNWALLPAITLPPLPHRPSQVAGVSSKATNTILELNFTCAPLPFGPAADNATVTVLPLTAALDANAKVDLTQFYFSNPDGFNTLWTDAQLANGEAG